MGNKLVPKTIFKGTRLAFKMDVTFALNEHPRIGVAEEKACEEVIHLCHQPDDQLPD
jgi:hypothetical protein